MSFLGYSAFFFLWLALFYFGINAKLGADEYHLMTYESSIAGPIRKSHIQEWIVKTKQSNQDNELNYINQFIADIPNFLPENCESPVLKMVTHTNIDTDKSSLDYENESADLVSTIAGPIRQSCALQFSVYENDNSVTKNIPLLTSASPTFYDKKIREHIKLGKECFNDANEMCEFVPKEKRHTAYALFEATIEASVGMAFAGYPGLVAALICNLTKYGIFVYEQCYQIKEKLDDSEYHYHMVIYYMNKKEEL